MVVDSRFVPHSIRRNLYACHGALLQVDNVFGKMKQRDAEDVLGDIAKQDRRINRARQSIAPERVSFFFFFTRYVS